MQFRHKCLAVIILFIVLIGIGIIYIYCNVIFIKPDTNIGQNTVSFGIIDGGLSGEHSNVVDTNANYEEKKLTHGDKILNFMSEYVFDSSFYYYDAEDDNTISTDKLLVGLQWMLDNNVECVSISLSSKFYSEEVADWMNENSNDIKVYASYSNTVNSLDYPASYNNVIGVGSSAKIEVKESDVIFRNSKLIVWSTPFRFYSGNSYLAPYCMVRDNINN
ncbi:hypothetical protein C8E03_103445 [Lachnotalea glycerini]|uniref:Peptidase S8/S53 domain-containing protein n=1 Tax=Lachnotalea glycerini TaxID=1763509 RepID=A0A318EQK1_9FIRM|nr:S8 family serine peptidase [Lachnotalea glycerini]PXV91874.1 hypothetical protein C8E03_103445 [Lachnotalea glycerini]